ncbi:MAG TPA: heme ABC exporter ATP-binding protein CcmA [Acidimicrobiia bacterium]|nr:heme ABC exporter ATP-binding protein CcmA [Acidimicrobiia bacterium]
MASIVDFDRVGVSLGGRPVLRDLHFELGPGESLGISGPNGSGKTTLVRTAATLTRPDRGTLSVLGAESTGPHLISVRRSIGMIGHQPALIGELTLAENLDHVARLAGLDPGRVMNALDVVGLAGAAERRAEDCSFGMRRRVEIAHLLLTRPLLLLLDEAASGLDDQARDLIVALLDSVLGRGGAAIVVSHDTRHLQSLCARLMRLDSGRLVA